MAEVSREDIMKKLKDYLELSLKSEKLAARLGLGKVVRKLRDDVSNMKTDVAGRFLQEAKALRESDPGNAKRLATSAREVLVGKEPPEKRAEALLREINTFLGLPEDAGAEKVKPKDVPKKKETKKTDKKKGIDEKRDKKAGKREVKPAAAGEEEGDTVKNRIVREIDDAVHDVMVALQEGDLKKAAEKLREAQDIVESNDVRGLHVKTPDGKTHDIRSYISFLQNMVKAAEQHENRTSEGRSEEGRSEEGKERQGIWTPEGEHPAGEEEHEESGEDESSKRRDLGPLKKDVDALISGSIFLSPEKIDGLIETFDMRVPSEGGSPTPEPRAREEKKRLLDAVEALKPVARGNDVDPLLIRDLLAENANEVLERIDRRAKGFGFDVKKKLLTGNLPPDPDSEDEMELYRLKVIEDNLVDIINRIDEILSG